MSWIQDTLAARLQAQVPDDSHALQVAEPDLLKACAGADVLLFVVPHQFIGKVCDQLKGHVKKDAVGVSLIKV